MNEFLAKATIAEGETVSTAVKLDGGSVTGLIIPADFDGANVSFQVSSDGEAFFTLDGVTVAVTAGNAVGVAPGDVYGWRYIKVVSDVMAADDDSDVLVIMKPL
jgi:hypothetical protein